MLSEIISSISSHIHENRNYYIFQYGIFAYFSIFDGRLTKSDMIMLVAVPPVSYCIVNAVSPLISNYILYPIINTIHTYFYPLKYTPPGKFHTYSKDQYITKWVNFTTNSGEDKYYVTLQNNPDYEYASSDDDDDDDEFKAIEQYNSDDVDVDHSEDLCLYMNLHLRKRILDDPSYDASPLSTFKFGINRSVYYHHYYLHKPWDYKCERDYYLGRDMGIDCPSSPDDYYELTPDDVKRTNFATIDLVNHPDIKPGELYDLTYIKSLFEKKPDIYKKEE